MTPAHTAGRRWRATLQLARDLVDVRKPPPMRGLGSETWLWSLCDDVTAWTGHTAASLLLDGMPARWHHQGHAYQGKGRR